MPGGDRAAWGVMATARPTAGARLLPWCGRAVRAGVYLVLGGAISAGYAVLVVGVWQLAAAAPSVPPGLTIAIAAIAVPIAAAPPLLAPVRDLGVSAARTFLDLDLPTPTAEVTRDDRLRGAGYFIAHLLTGAVATTALLFGVPYAVGLIGWSAGSRGDGFQVSAPNLGGWGVLVAVGILVAMPLFALLGRALLRAVAVPLLGPSASARELAERNRRIVLAERNRIARELHDGVGHALAITTMQASAAEAALASDDPAAVRAALAEIARVGRQAMGDLDTSLAVLRAEHTEGEATADSRAPARTLADLEALAAGTEAGEAGDGGPVRLHGDPSDLEGIDPLVSREAYQLVAEAVVNGRRHGQGPIDLTWHRTNGAVTLEVSNAVGHRRTRAGGGRGLVGMRERATLIGAELDAGRVGDRWRVQARIPGGAG